MSRPRTRSGAHEAATAAYMPPARRRSVATSPVWTRSWGCRSPHRRSPTTSPGEDCAGASARSARCANGGSGSGARKSSAARHVDKETDMVPTLAGRIQTRLFLLAVVGGLVTAAITPVLPLTGPLDERYRTTFVVLATVAVLGIAWECLYHLLMQWRWEKDWPTLAALLTLVPEGVLIWVLLRADLVPTLDGPDRPWAFWVHFVVVWVAVWSVAQGPMRVPFVRWRFRGGRLL